MKKLIIFPLGFLCILFIYTLYMPKKNIEYRVTEKEFAHELFNLIRIDKNARIIEVRNLDNKKDGNLLVVYEY